MSGSGSVDGSSRYEFRDCTGSIVPHILVYVVQLLALASAPFRGRRALFSTLIVGLVIVSQINPRFTNNIALAQPFTISWSVYISTLEKILFSADLGPEASFWHQDRAAKEAVSYSAFGIRKLRWALVIMLNQRGVRWNFEVKNTPKATIFGRWSFLKLQTLNLIYYILMADLMCQLSIRLFYTAPSGETGLLDSKYLTLTHSDWRWSLLKAFVFGATPYYMCCFQYTIFSIPAVLLRLSKAEDWPPIFGQLKDATSVRKFWGQYWHQTIRKSLTAYSTAFVKICNISRGTTLSAYTQIWLAFAISGVMHANSMRVLPRPISISTAECTIGMVQFFLWQAMAITIEDFVMLIWKRGVGRMPPEYLRTLFGWGWVVSSFWYSMSWAGDVMLRMRLGEETFLPGTVLGPWVEKFVPIPP